MARTLQDLLDEARARRANQRQLDALKVYRLILEAAPLDFDLRLEIGDLLEELGREDFSTTVYKAVAEHDTKAGNPLRAMVALKLLLLKQVFVRPLVVALQEKYAFGSEVLGRSIKLAPTDYSQSVRAEIDLSYPVEQGPFIAQTTQMAAHTESIANYPPLVPPLPIFSTLESGAFGELFGRLSLKRFRRGVPIIRQGEAGESVFFIARGEVDIVRRRSVGGGEQQLARLGPGSVFGEMALLSDEPRSASVVAGTDVDVLELSRSDAETLAKKMPNVGGALQRFTRERMIGNLFATNPLFVLFKDEDRKKLLARFTGHEVPAGTIFLEQGDVGRGLYVILQGKAEVVKKEAGQVVKIAEIGAGDIAGEMSLVNEAPVSATVRTTQPSTLLFLARELFLAIIENIPELKDYFKKLSDVRAEDAEFKVKTEQLRSSSTGEEIEEEIDLSDDELVFI